MPFISISKARGLTIGKQVFTLNNLGEYGIGKLVSKTEDSKGLHLKFEVPQYFDEKMPAVKPVYVENITHVEVIKNRSEE